MNKPKVLLLSGYDAPSHQYWRETLANGLAEFQWTQIALPARYFSWRIRGNAFNFFSEYKALLEKSYDLLIVTSMVDLNNLRGLIPNLVTLPTILYFHENQFAYPLSNASENEKQNLINAQITSLFCAYSADRILFNSNFNMSSFFQGASRLVKKLPDGISESELSIIGKKSKVLPVPIDVEVYSRNQKNNNEPIKILWNHRWEFDKQPEVFIQAMRLIKNKGINFEFYILGQSFRNKPGCFKNTPKEFKKELKVFGYQPREKYDEIMKQSDIVISSALHDFQGLSMLEAILNGCIPIAPNRVAYPEYIDATLLYEVGQFNINETKQSVTEQEADVLADKLINLINSDTFIHNRNELIQKCQTKTEPYCINNLITDYKHEIQKLID